MQQDLQSDHFGGLAQLARQFKSDGGGQFTQAEVGRRLNWNGIQLEVVGRFQNALKMRFEPVLQRKIHLGMPQKSLIFKGDSTTCATCGGAGRSLFARWRFGGFPTTCGGLDARLSLACRFGGFPTTCGGAGRSLFARWRFGGFPTTCGGLDARLSLACRFGGFPTTCGGAGRSLFARWRFGGSCHLRWGWTLAFRSLVGSVVFLPPAVGLDAARRVRSLASVDEGREIGHTDSQPDLTNAAVALDQICV